MSKHTDTKEMTVTIIGHSPLLVDGEPIMWSYPQHIPDDLRKTEAEDRYHTQLARAKSCLAWSRLCTERAKKTKQGAWAAELLKQALTHISFAAKNLSGASGATEDM